jgi:stalled ribosome rescue protein Dom34
MPKQQVAVWIDHKKAHIYHVHPDRIDESTVTAPPGDADDGHAGRDGTDKSHEAKRFFQEVTRSIEGAGEILLVGPKTAKLHFLRYLRKHHHGLESRIVGIESVDQPTGGRLIACVHEYFKSSDGATDAPSLTTPWSPATP